MGGGKKGGGKGGGGGGSNQVHVAEYYMSIHFGWCWGPVDAITQIWVGEKMAWGGEVTALTNIFINWNSLFGGRTKEGGVFGNAYFLPGRADQLMPPQLAGRLGRSVANCPGFRGQCNLFFCEGGNYASFMWGANNPYMRTVWARFRRIPKGLSEATARIGEDANPAHIIYECLVNKDWGMGAPTTLINGDNFEAVASALYDEAFGLSMVWSKSTKCEAFIGEVLDHIQATLFIDPRTGLYTLKLIRDDYDIEDLPVFGPDNCQIQNYQVKGWGETANEIVVTYTDGSTEEEATVTVQNIANIAVQGGQVVSDNRNYYGIRNPDLASKVAGRDLRNASSPLRTCDMLANRRGWSLTPGSVLVLNWPEYSIESLVMRIGSIDYGKPGDGTIKVSLVEDVFEPGVFIEPPTTEWVDPSEEPAPMTYARMFTLPSFIISNVSPDASAIEYPEVMIGMLAAQPGSDTPAYQFMVESTRGDGSLFYRDDGRFIPVGYAVLTSPLAQEGTTVTPLPGSVNGRLPQQDGLLFIGDDTDDKMEIARLRSFDADDGWTIDRAIFDTVPRAWPIGTPVWYVANNTRTFDSALFAAGDTLNLKLLTRTSKGALDLEDAPVVTGEVIDRPHRPNRPGNVKVGGTAFGIYDARSDSTIAITWGNRNRLLEDAVVVEWADGDVVPEVGQTTTVILINADGGAVVNTIDGLVGTSYDLSKAEFGGYVVDGIVRVTAKREDLESLQGHEIAVTVRDTLFSDLVDGQSTYAGQGGKFVRVNSSGTGLVFVAAPSVQVAYYKDDVFDPSQILTRYVTVEAWQLKANLAGSQVNAGAAATGSPAFAVKKNGSSVGTITITGTTPSLATSGGTAVSFAAGDILEITAPASADSTLSKLSIVLVGPKV